MEGVQGLSEVQFFFRAEFQGTPYAFALVDVYSAPYLDFLEESFNTVWSCGHGRGQHLTVIPAKDILAVVAMVPHSIIPGAAEKYADPENTFFLVEKPGLDLMQLAGYREDEDNIDNFGSLDK